MGSNLTNDMTKGSTTTLLLKFSVPMLIGNIFQQFYSIIDAVVVGNYVGSDALAAVGAAGPPNFFIFSLALGLAAGVAIIISQYFGAKDEENVKKSFATAAYTIIGASIIMGIIGFFLSKPLLQLLNTPEDIINQTDIFMKISCVGIIGVCSYNGMAAILRALGDSVTPLFFLIAACVMNIVLDLIFVLGFHMEVAGVAWATTISQMFSAIGCILYAFKKVKILRMPRKDFYPDKIIFKKCLLLGLPVALQNALVAASTMALQGVINGFGPTVMAASTATNRIEQLILQPGMSLGAAVSTYTGQNVGAGNFNRVKKGFKSATGIIIIFSLIMLPVIYFGGNYIMDLFTTASDTEVLKIGIKGLRINCFFYTFVGMIFITRNLLSGAGDVRITMIMGFCEVISRITFANVLAVPLGFQGVWWATGLTWFTTSLIGIFRYLSGKWKNKSIVTY